MDLLLEIKQKNSSLHGHSAGAGIDAVVRHIERAERHLAHGRSSGDEDAFNDVVYRTNQAFEGALKEAFLLLTDAASTDLATYQIEQRLLATHVLVPRVADLLTNYRRQWRNPSTHDHRLILRDQEAFLAIVSVSAFVSVLVDQMVEALSRRREQEEAERRQQHIREILGDYSQLPLDEQVVRLLQAFDQTSAHEGGAGPLTEFEILGRLAGFIGTVDPEIQLQREPVLKSDARVLRPDLVLTKAGDTVVLELHRKLRFRYDLKHAQQQVVAYLIAGGWNKGVIFAPPFATNMELRIEELDWDGGFGKMKIHAVFAVDVTETPLERLLSPREPQ